MSRNVPFFNGEMVSVVSLDDTMQMVRKTANTIILLDRV